MRLDHLLSKELHQNWWPSSCPHVVRVVAHGWNINEWALHLLVTGFFSTALAHGTGVRRLWGFEVEARYWVLRLHAHPWSFGAMVCVAGPPCHWVSADAGLVVVWGCSLRTA